MSKFHAPEKAIYVCVGSKCGKRGGKDMCKELKDLIKEKGLKDEVEIVKTECTDRCKFAPILSVQPANVWLREYSEKDAPRILKLAFQDK
ncbi:(2Fe-2S) ferredoxin domain-containing protein [Rhodocytophaga rosea]|jgi:(2Fe-2S) ferredoxin|uniref:(2Fe-2S) ferredoxin domain-containing protein n=1 Tax=Rhodocytophaga rosea TaxID=2704465 RepID=A0A6C0GN88_9BACT|nr:(2Fe-2S) ferredoxin domain-containing protein [Rhodocytophaga rosea]QHT69485.1 (2Fe-2S) ferredoxin domain-containing protein [Rhodocytophaga rosea]